MSVTEADYQPEERIRGVTMKMESRLRRTKFGLAIPMRPQILAYRVHFLAAVADALASGETAPTRDVNGVLRLVRCHLGRYGEEYAIISDNYNDKAIQPFIDEAEQIVDRLFPFLRVEPAIR